MSYYLLQKVRYFYWIEGGKKNWCWRGLSIHMILSHALFLYIVHLTVYILLGVKKKHHLFAIYYKISFKILQKKSKCRLTELLERKPLPKIPLAGITSPLSPVSPYLKHSSKSDLRTFFKIQEPFLFNIPNFLLLF